MKNKDNLKIILDDSLNLSLNQIRDLLSKMTSSDVLDVSFIVTNPAEDQNSPTISIAAIIKNLRGRLHITEPCFKPRQPCC